MTCTNPATDGIQGATYGEWVLLQDNEVTSEFALTSDGDPLPGWSTRHVEIVVWNGTEYLTIDPLDIVKLDQPTDSDPTAVQVTIGAAQTADPTITGWYRISSSNADDSHLMTHRYGPFIVRRSMWVGTNPLP